MPLARLAISAAVRAEFQMPTSAISEFAWATMLPEVMSAPIYNELAPVTLIFVIDELPMLLFRYTLLEVFDEKVAAPCIHWPFDIPEIEDCAPSPGRSE